MVDSIQDLARAAASLRGRAMMGDLTGTREMVNELDAAGAPLARAWGAAIRAQVCLMFPGSVSLPAEADLERFVTAHDNVRRTAAFAARDLALASFLVFDCTALDQWTQHLARLVCDEEGAIDLAIVRALGRLLDGRPPVAGFDETVSHAATIGHAAAVIEAQAIRAMLALEAADLSVGLGLARRSSLMASAEGLPEAEFFANLVLARARRYNRQAHLAQRVIEGLERVVTPGWLVWLAWESAFAGGDPAPGPTVEGTEIATLLEAARAGDRRRFDERRTSLRAQLGGGLFGREAADLGAALDPESEPLSENVRAWRHGETQLLSSALSGLGHRNDAEEPRESAAAYVLVPEDGRALRFLHQGLPMVLGPGGGGTRLARLPQSRRSEGRVDTLLAVLALAGPDGLDEETCFARAYGFPYVPETHRGVFDVLVHRARAAVEGVGRLERWDGRLALATSLPLLLPDPRVCQRITDRVLRLLARHGRASAKEVASKLGVSLRAVQGALNDLARDSACVVERVGRRISYAVEDTVFSKVTLRFAPAQLSARQEFG